MKLAYGVISSLLAAVLCGLPGCNQSAAVDDKAATQRMEDVKADIKVQLDAGMKQHKQSQFRDMPPGVTLPSSGVPGAGPPAGPPGVNTTPTTAAPSGPARPR